MKVFVGLSGGVDSAVSAALLKERGHDVVGAFIKIWSPEFLECTWRRDRLDAMRVAAALGIPFKEVDLSEAYRRDVAQEMVESYRRGITPNPDVLCNTNIKFGAFASWAFGEGAEMVATGHYARVETRDGAHRLLRGLDANKDQSYFLWQLEEGDLARALFPVGEYAKRDVRGLAKKYNLPVAEKPDSQGLCFLGDVRLEEFLARFLPLEEGAVESERGRVIGVHRGAALYTPGQRHGFTITDPSARGVPHYIVRVDAARNVVYASPKKKAALRIATKLGDVRFREKPKFPARLLGQARYREAPASCLVAEGREGVVVSFVEPRLLSPGQSLVLYSGDVCLGGGVILPREASVESASLESAAQVQ